MQLTELPIFLKWRLTDDGKKIPVGMDGQEGVDKQTAPLAEVEAKTSDSLIGNGVVIRSDTPICFIDLDDYSEGKLIPRRVLELFSRRAYIEKSISGNGYHIIARCDNKDGMRPFKSPKLEFYFDKRFCALTGRTTVSSLDLKNVLQVDCTQLVHDLYAAITYLISAPADVSAMFAHGIVDNYPSSSEYDFALVKKVMKYTQDHRVIRGLLILSESDVRRVREGKNPKLENRQDYIEDTIRRIAREWQQFVVQERFDAPTWEKDNLIWINKRPVVRRRAFTLIKSLTGVGKSHFAITLASCLYGPYLGSHIESSAKTGRILYIDTEMGKDLTARMRDIAVKRVGRNNEQLMTFASVKETHFADRLSVIGKLSRDYKADIIVIDGLRDLMLNFNDIRETYSLIQELETLSVECNCAVVGTLHTNPGEENTKARGHVGTEMEQKAFAVIHLKKDESSNVITVKHFKTRVSRSFPDFNLKFSEVENWLENASQKEDLPF